MGTGQQIHPKVIREKSKWSVQEKLYLALILVLGSFLRLYQLAEIPYTHDEFSALFRTGFTNFSELIEKGVLVDFHPAGVQVFLNYYILWFGKTEWVVKLPFIISGIAAIYVAFILGKEWTNTRTGLLLAAFISCTQYFIFYSQIARPYAPGLLLGLLALIYWRRFLWDGERARPKYFLLWILFASLCAYTHYYLLLTVFLTALMGLFLSPRERRPLYVLSGFLILLLYSPHLSVFKNQVSKGGIGSWLGKPDSSFISDFILYVFQYNSIFLMGLVLLIFISLFLKGKLDKNTILGFTVFCLSIGVGYLYSIKINPILQFSGLIFSTPFLLIGLFSFLSYKKWMFHVGMWTILILGTYSLWQERLHYEVFYQSPYEAITIDIKNEIENTKKNHINLINDRTEILAYYLNKYELETDEIMARPISVSEFKNLLETSNADQLNLGVFAISEPELIPIALHYFPSIKIKNSYFLAQFFQFEKGKNLNSSLFWLEDDLLNLPKESYWQNPSKIKLSSDSLGERYISIPNSSGYSPSISISSPRKLIQSTNGFFDLEIELGTDNMNDLEDVFIAFSVHQNDQLILWQTQPMNRFLQKTRKESKTLSYHSIALNAKLLNKENIMLKASILNEKGVELKIYNATARLRSGNPKLYSLFSEVGY